MTAVAATALILSAAAPAAPADAQVRAGGHGVYKSHAFDGSFGVGGRAEVDLGFLRRGLVLSGTYDRLFPDCEGCSSSELGGQLIFVAAGPLYMGLGAGYAQFDEGGGQFASESSDWAFSYLAGLRLQGLPVIVPFLEFRQEFGSESLNEQTFQLGLLLSPTGARPAPRRPFAP